MTMIFGIGLNKTATFSLHSALTILGYRSLHWGGPETRRAVMRALAESRPLLTYVDDEFNAFSDIVALTYNFELLDTQYPGSKFILTERPLDEWLDSRRRHVEKNQLRKARGEYSGSFLEVNIEGWRADYRAHTRRVTEYFSHRPHDLLRIDITAGDGWAPLCQFLDRPVPAAEFPWKNRYQPPAEATGT